MRDLGRTLLLCAIMVGPSCALAAGEARRPDPAPAAAIGSDAPSWAGEDPRPGDARLGFAPLSVTQSGVAYSPAAPAFDPAATDQPKIADLPAWASSRFTAGEDRRQGRPGILGSLGFGALPEPAAWALILIGTAMICGALRGLIMAHRRLDRLRDEDEAPD